MTAVGEQITMMEADHFMELTEAGELRILMAVPPTTELMAVGA